MSAQDKADLVGLIFLATAVMGPVSYILAVIRAPLTLFWIALRRAAVVCFAVASMTLWPVLFFFNTGGGVVAYSILGGVFGVLALAKQYGVHKVSSKGGGKRWMKA